MCLNIGFGWKKKPQPSEGTLAEMPSIRPGAVDPAKVEETPNVTVMPYNEPAVTATQVKQIPAIPNSLPSQVDETLADCPRFRIILVGNSGVGKSSLVRSIFNIDPDKIDIRHDRAGEADINREYASFANPRFILHDSKGFEAGSKVNWVSVESFLQKRSRYDLLGKIHAIWLCVETPRTGTRLLQTGDEELLKLAKKFNIPIIAVFTKYDQLITQFWRQDNQSGKSKQTKEVDAEKNALDSFHGCVKDLRKEWASIPCVKVSTAGTNAHQSLIDLTNTTRSRLQEVEDKLLVLWVAAQQVNARQKVEVSISEGFKSNPSSLQQLERCTNDLNAEYWRDLGQSSEFEGKILVDCIHRIHDDILKVWNFNDPTKILSGTEFFTEMIGLVKPLIDDQVDQTLLPIVPVPGFGSAGATVLVPLLENFGFKLPAIQYLYNKYQKYPSTGRFLATYIINLVLILHGVFTDLLLQSSDPPRALSNDVVVKGLARHKFELRRQPLGDIDIATNPEQVIDDVIKKRLELLPN